MRTDKKRKKVAKGTALILVVVVTVLLAAIGVMFVMVSRIQNMTTLGLADAKDLDSAARSAVEKINTVLVKDLFGNDLNASVICDNSAGNEPYDHSLADPWLASLEPVLHDQRVLTDPTDDWYKWPAITNLTVGTANFVSPQWDLILRDSSGGPWTLPQYLGIVPDYQEFDAILQQTPEYVRQHPDMAIGLPADADGDGVADSIWIKMDNLSTSKGKPVFAAVRIIDNCAMLNLNTAFKNDAALPGTGSYLSEVDYETFLRGRESDPANPVDRDNFRKARKADGTYNPAVDTPTKYQNDVILNIENPGTGYSLFDIGDELEIRNRFLLSGKTIARFERTDIGHYTFDAFGGIYAALSVPRESSNFNEWKMRLNLRNFDISSVIDPAVDKPYYFDRRHVCTFYSFDRNLLTGGYAFLSGASETVKNYFRPANHRPINLGQLTFANNPDSRKQIVYLLYAFREHFLDEGFSTVQAARKAAQIVANMIDYYDDADPTRQGPFFSAAYGSQKNQNPTFITRAIIRQLVLDASGSAIDIGQYPTSPQSDYEFCLGLSDTAATPPGQLETVYGYERQPFIAEVYCNYNSGAGGAQAFAIELLNPYQNSNGQIPLQGWQITVGTQTFALNNPAYVIFPATSDTAPGRVVFWAENVGYSVPYNGTNFNLTGFGLGTQLLSGDQTIKLQRPDPANAGQFITVDQTTDTQTTQLIAGGVRVSKRDDSGWKFANRLAYAPADGIPRLGFANNVISARAGFQLPVANKLETFATLWMFQKAAFLGSSFGTTPDPITQKIAAATRESDVRFDPAADAGLLKYICFLNRGNGMTNEHNDGTLPGRINVNTAARPVLAAAIAPGLADPNLPELLTEIIQNRPYQNLGDLLKIDGMKKYVLQSGLNVGDQSIDNDIEERDWILGRLANIYTVRSDTFTAYILVRLGADGPQRRMMAIFDRSNVWKPSDRPKLVALHPVPDPR